MKRIYYFIQLCWKRDAPLIIVFLIGLGLWLSGMFGGVQ